jgi:hypothetical protein
MISVNNWQSKNSTRHADKCSNCVLIPFVFMNLALLRIIGDFKLTNIVFYVLTVFFIPFISII